MNPKFFGEGICSLNDQHQSFLRLTWMDNVVDVLDTNLRRVETMPLFDGLKEGWGVTRDGSRLIVSDGSEYLNFFNAHTFENEGEILVKMPNNQRVKRLNELEFVNGSVWANIF